MTPQYHEPDRAWVIRVTWTPRMTAGGIEITEETGELKTIWHDVPASLYEAFVAERKSIIEKTVERLTARYLAAASLSS